MMMSDVQLNLSKKLFNNKFLPLLNNNDRYLVLMGGGGSGKSVFASQKIVYRILNERGHRVLVLRKVAKTLRESVFMEFKKTISNWRINHLFQIPKGASSDLYIRCINGNEILFAGLDDVEKLKSISGVTSIWIEEASEIVPEDFRQLDIRLRGKTKNYKQMIISFNPIDVNHWLKKEFFDVAKQNCTTLHSTYKDNKFLDDEAIKVLEAFKETDPYFYQVYALGEWGVLGKTIFNAQKVSERIAFLRQKYSNNKPKQGYFTFDYENDRIIDKSIKWLDDKDGYITIYEDVKDKLPYVLGGDTAGEGSDSFTGHVIDNTTGKQVAVLKHQFDEHYYARQMYCLAKHYNNALVGMEVNFSTFPTREFERWNYTKMYVREVQDSYTHRLEKRFGFVTGRVTRPLLIANLVQIVDENINLINDIPTLEEMMTFVRNEKGKQEAQEGAHDDLIMGLGITYQIRDQQSYTVDKAQKFDVSKLSKDAQEDYWNAPPNMRAYLLKKWGVIK